MFVQDAIEIYMADQRSQGLAESTLYGQLRYVARFGRACEKVADDRQKRQPLTVKEIDQVAITRYFETCVGGAGNRNNMTVVLRKFLNFCEQERWLKPGDTKRLMARRKNSTYHRQPKHYVPVEQFGTLLDVAGERHPADRAVMALALYTLCRRSEIQGLQLKHVDLPGANLDLYRLKKKRWTPVTIQPELMDELTTWLEWYARKLGYINWHSMRATQPEWFVIPRILPVRPRDDHGKFQSDPIDWEIDPLDHPTHMENILKRGLDRTGAQTRDGKMVRHLGEGLHTIRRSGARAMLKHLSPIMGSADALVTVSVMLDHEDTNVTLRYIGMDQQRAELNDWLRGNSMYGTRAKAGPQHLKAVR